MRMLKLGAVAGLAFLVAACPPRDRDVAVTEDETFEPAVTEQPVEAPPAAERVNLEQIEGSGVTGEVHATPRDNATDIQLLVRNGPPNESLGARVHSGTCENPGPELAQLDAVRTDDMGQGQSETNVGHAPHLIMDGNHIVAVHRPGADPEVDAPLACATLPQHAGAAGTGM